MRNADFQNKVLSEIATLQQQVKTLEASMSGEEGLSAFKREVKEERLADGTRIKEAHLRINQLELDMKDKAGKAEMVLSDKAITDEQTEMKLKLTKIIAYATAALFVMQLAMKFWPK